MSRRNTIILILAAVLLTGFSIALSRRDSRDWRANRSRRVFPFPWQDAASITIDKPDGTRLVLKKGTGGEWNVQVSDELSDSLNPAIVDDLAAFATLSWREAQKNRKPPYPGKATVVTAANQIGQTVKLEFGDIADNLRATVIDDDRETVYGVNQDLLGFLDWPPERFRNLYLVTAGGGKKPKRIVIAPAPLDPSLTLRFEQGSDGWRLTEPVTWPVDESRLDVLIRWLDRLRGDSIEAEMAASEDLEWFGFTPESPSVEAWYDSPSGPIHRRVEFGKETEDGKLYARETSRNPLFAVSREALTEISMDIAREHPAAWRNYYRLRAINPVGDALPEAICIERLLPTPSKLTLEQVREQTGVKWRGKLEDAGGIRVFPVDAPDGSDFDRALTTLIAGMSSLQVKNFLADLPPGNETIQWTAYPAWRFTILNPGMATPPTLTLYAANPQGDLPPGKPYVEGKAGPQEMTPQPDSPDRVGIAFSIGDKPAIMELPADRAFVLCLPLYRYQSRRVIDLEPRQWNRVEILADKEERVYQRNAKEINEQWWRKGEPDEPLMDDNNRFVALTLDLSQLKSDGFVADINGDIAEFGLDQPEITAIVYSSLEGTADNTDGNRLFKLSLGKTADEEGRRYARLNDAGPVFLVSGRIAKALKESYR